MSRIASVLLPMPLPEAFDYAEPDGMGLELGDQVAAPLGPRLLRGVVVGLREAAGGNRPLKPLEAILEEPRLPPGTVEFVKWAARYSVDWPGQPLAIALDDACLVGRAVSLEQCQDLGQHDVRVHIDDGRLHVLIVADRPGRSEPRSAA